MFPPLTRSSAVRAALISIIVSALYASAAPGGISGALSLANILQLPLTLTDMLLTTTAPALSVSVSGPDTVTDVKNLLLKVTVTNTGDQTLKLINDPRGPLTKSPTDLFTITGPKGKGPAFIGISTKYAGVDWVAANGKSNAFTVLDRGKSVTISHDLSRAYDFRGSGVGQYKFEANNLFHHVDEKKRAVPVKADSKSHQLELKGKLFANEHDSDVHQFATFVGCTAAQQTPINAAIPAARTYVFNAISYIQAHTTASPRFTTWFGAFQSTRRSAVLSNFNSLTTRGNEFTAWTYDCTLVDCDPDVYAFVNPTVYGVVHLCDEFWTAPATGTNSKAGTLVHEGTHFVGTAGTVDIAYGKDECRQLAITNPNQAIRNADSYEYFAENTPPLA